MTDLKPEDLVTRLQRLASSRRAGVERDIKNGFGDCLAGAEVTVNLMLLEQALSLLADRARMEKALRNLTRAFDSLQVERWDDETKVEIHLPRTKRVRPVSWVYVSDVKEARQAIGASQ